MEEKNYVNNLTFRSVALLCALLAAGCGGGGGSPSNQAPFANAGLDQIVNSGAAVALTGSGHDNDGSVASYLWSQISGLPAVTLGSANSPSASFTAPDVNTDRVLVFRLTVTDDKGATGSDTVVVVIRAHKAPIAGAGHDQPVHEGDPVMLPGTGFDEDGAVVAYHWAQKSGAPLVALNNAETQTTSFTAPQVDQDSALVFTLTVTDDSGLTGSDDVIVTVLNAGSPPADNHAPTATAPPARSVPEGTPVVLVGNGADPDAGDSISFHWEQNPGTAPVALAGENTSTVSFVAPQVSSDTTLEFTLTVTDSHGASDTDTVAVTVRDVTPINPCPAGQLCAGSAKRSISPTDRQVEGVLEDRYPGTSVKQKFHLGGFDFGPFEASKFFATYSDGALDERTCRPTPDSPGSDPISAQYNDAHCVSAEAAKRAYHCKDAFAHPDDPENCADNQKDLTWVRAFYLSQPAEAGGAATAVIFVTLDAVGAGNIIIGGVKDEVHAKTGVALENIIVGMTHSHAGADLQGLWGGVPQKWITDKLYLMAGEAAKAAKDTARSATLTYATGNDGAFNHYRRPRVDKLADADPALSVMQARDASGAVLGTLVQYAAHPTAVGRRAGCKNIHHSDPEVCSNEDGDIDIGRSVHPDYVLGLEDTIEAASGGATALYYNGPIADASGDGPTTGDDDYANVRSRGECLARSVLTLLDPENNPCSFSELKKNQIRRTTLQATLTARSETATLPITNPAFLAVALAGSFNRYYDFTQLPLAEIPGIGPDIAALQPNLPQIAPIASSLVTRITIGGAGSGLEVVTIPGEGTNTFGQYIRSLTDNKNMMLLGLTQNSLGYILPEEEFNYIDASGDAGFVLPFTGYEEFVSLGPLTAPLLRLQAYNPLFDVAPDDPRNLPPSLTACKDPTSRACVTTRLIANVDYIQRAYANICRDNLVGNAPAEMKAAAAAFCGLLDPETPLYQPCVDSKQAPQSLCDALGTGHDTPDQQLAGAALDALLRNCDLLDPSNCLYPFPNNYFTAPSVPGTPQSPERGGTGRRVNIHPAATPRNAMGRPVDPTEWNRNDGFSPGALITTYVPGLSLEKTFSKPATEIGVANLALSQDDSSPIMVLEVPEAPEKLTLVNKHLVWSEIDANANQLVMLAAPQAGHINQSCDQIPDPVPPEFRDGCTSRVGQLPAEAGRPLSDGKAALLIRPAKNFTEGRRYIVVLRNLKNSAGARIAAQAGFAACRDHAPSALLAVIGRCAALDGVFNDLKNAGIARDESLYLAWDFTVASANNTIGRLRHMRDDAFRTLSANKAIDDCTQYRDNAPCVAPGFTVDNVTDHPERDDPTIARRIEGTLTVPSYLVPVEPAPLQESLLSIVLDGATGVLDKVCNHIPADGSPKPFHDGCVDFRSTLRDGAAIGQGASLPPNRLLYRPTDNSAPSPDPSNWEDPTGLRYGDGLPDRSGTMNVRYICQIPSQANPDNPARAGIYGHGLLDRGVAITYDGVPDMSREYNYMFCAVDWFGFATGDTVNVVSTLADLSNFPVVPDASQQGMVNFMFLARLLRDSHGFSSHPAFQDAGSHRPLFDRSEVIYDGNSQGGILGGVVLAASKDVNRGALGSLGMNYSTLLTRSKDFDEYAMPLYAAYTDPLDRQLLFSMIQMLWDRSENDGYAAHLTDNSAFGGPSNAVKLDPNFGDQQVTMWSADVMARTMGIPYDHQQTQRVEALGTEAPGPNGRRHPDLTPQLGLTPLDYANAGQAAGGALIIWDSMRKGSFAKVPPITNTPPRDGEDPHDNSARTLSGRCQKAHFFGAHELIDVTGFEFTPGFSAADCPPVLQARPTIAVATVPADRGLSDILKRLFAGLGAALDALLSGDLQRAANAVLAAVGAIADDALLTAATGAGDATGRTITPDAPRPVDNPAPLPLMAGAARGLIRVPVGAPLGGYLRPPVGGEYLPGGEDLAAGNPNTFFNELLDFIPFEADGCDQTHPDSCVPLAPLPDELRKLHSPYATYSPPSRGYYDSLITKAVALYDGHDYVVLVKNDFIGMLDEVVQAVADQVQADMAIDIHEGLVMSGTHTHDGPGAIANNSTRYFWLAMDAYQPDLYKRIVPQIAKVVEDALSDLQPARFGFATGTESHLRETDQSDRFLNSFRRADSKEKRDALGYDFAADVALRRRIGVLRVDRLDAGDQPQPLALIMNYAAHGIAFDVENQYFSGDVLASAEREVEQGFGTQVLAMLVQNTGGDVSPRADGGPTLQRIERFGKLLAPQVRAIYDSVHNWDTQPDLRAVSQRVVLSRDRLGYGPDEFPYQWGGAQCNSDNAVPFADVGVSDLQKNDPSGLSGVLPARNPACIFGTAPDAADLADNGVGENGAFLPQDTRLTAVKIGSALLLAQPGEPLSEYGVRLLREVKDKVGNAYDNTFVWGYSQDHVGYILAPEKKDWDLGGTEGTTTFWGWKQGQRFIDVSRDLAKALRDGTPAPADEFKANYFYRDLYKEVPPPAAIPSLRPGRIIAQPADIERFQQTSFSWEGGDPVGDSPDVSLEHLVGSQWQPVRRANGEAITSLFEMHLKYRFETSAHVWTLDFEAPKDWALGSYRFSVSSSAFSGDRKSQAFLVKPSASLQLSAPVCAAGSCTVTLAYTPRPRNYRLIDAETPAERAAPVRQGKVHFISANARVDDSSPDLESRDGGNPVTVKGDPETANDDYMVAVYRANITGSSITATGEDAWGNTTAGATAPVASALGYGSGVIGALAQFSHDLNAVIAAALIGDFTTASTQLQTAFTDLANNAGGLPQAGTADKLIGLDKPVDQTLARSASAMREAAPVILTGAQLPALSVPAAQGYPYPYPSGAVTTGQAGDATGLIPGQVRDPHNGVIVYPPADSTAAPMGIAAERLAAYAWDGAKFNEIPLQVDQKYPYFLANAASDFSVYSGTDEELTYEWDLERWDNRNPDDPVAHYDSARKDPVSGFDDDDELAFMWSDAGSRADLTVSPTDLNLDLAQGLQEIALVDPLNPDPAKTRFVYIGVKKAGSKAKFADRKDLYVNYYRDANSDQWIDRYFFRNEDPQKIGTSNTGYGPNRSGKVHPPVVNGELQYFKDGDFDPKTRCGKSGDAPDICNSMDRFPRDAVTVSTGSYLWRATGRWMIREISVAKPGQPGIYGDDLLDRWKGRAFQQSPDSNISVVGFEDEQVNWEANSSLLGERCGPVRCMREIWGADSGTNVTKTETFYRDAVSYRYHVRVHPIPPDGLYTAWDYNRSAMVSNDPNVPGGRYYTALRPQGVPIDGENDDVGQMDGFMPVAGQCPQPDANQDHPQDSHLTGGAASNGNCPAFFDAADATFNLPLAFDNWEQVSGKGNLGSLVYTFENKGNTSYANPLVVPYYRDDACLDDGTGDDPVQRPWPGESYEWRGGAVRQAYNAAAGRVLDYKTRADCKYRQGAYGAHGVHYFFTHDSDNAFVFGKPSDEVDGQQWQFMVPTAEPKNIGEPYGNIVRVPLVPVVVSRPGVSAPDTQAQRSGGVLGFVASMGTQVTNVIGALSSMSLDVILDAGRVALGHLFDGLRGLLYEDGTGSAAQILGPVGSGSGSVAGTVSELLEGVSNAVLGSTTGSKVRVGVGVVDMTPDVGYCAGQYCGKAYSWAEEFDPTDPQASFDRFQEDMSDARTDYISQTDPFLTHKGKYKSYGVQSRLTARAIVVEGSNGKRIALLKSDNYLAQDALVRRIAQILNQGHSGIGYEDILYHVTHNHSAAYSSSLQAGLALFEDAFDPRFFENQARKLARAIELAAADLRPARMGAIEIQHRIYKGNVVRTATADDGTPAGYPLEYNDHGLVVLRFDEVDGSGKLVKPIALWMNWGEHPESLNGYGLHSADFLASLERWSDREIGAPLLFSQGDVGSSENSANHEELIADDASICGDRRHPESALCNFGEGVQRDWNHRGYVQTERNVRFLFDDVKKAWTAIASLPEQSAAPRKIGFTTDFEVGAMNAWVPGPLSHPYPSVSNCRTETSAQGDVGVPVVGLPDCGRFGFPGENQLTGQSGMIYAEMKAEGVPVPDHYDAGGYGGVEDNHRLKLQAVRLGEILLASCACEAQDDLILNLESRLDAQPDNIYDGFDWACLIDAYKADPAYTQACATQEHYFDRNARDARGNPLNATGVPGSNFSADAIAHMRHQVHNDAKGWDEPQNALAASSETTDVNKIWGNFTRQEIQKLFPDGTPPAKAGYMLPVGIGHAGDYNGYTVSYREYMNRDSYRKALTSYGPHTADYMVTRLVRMAAQLKGGADFVPEAHDAAAQADEARQQGMALLLGQATYAAYEAYHAALPNDVGPAAALQQPVNTARFGAATFSWRGGSTAIDNPRVTVERCTLVSQSCSSDQDWAAFADQTGEVQTLVKFPNGPAGVVMTYVGLQEWQWTANFEAYSAFPARLGSTPLGQYRFRVAGKIRQNGGTLPYAFTSQPFSVLPYGRNEGVSINSRSAGAVTYSTGTTGIGYEKSYPHSPFPFINALSGDALICDQCSFRPWASSGSLVNQQGAPFGGEVAVLRGSLVVGNPTAANCSAQGGGVSCTASGLATQAGDELQLRIFDQDHNYRYAVTP